MLARGRRRRWRHGVFGPRRTSLLVVCIICTLYHIIGESWILGGGLPPPKNLKVKINDPHPTQHHDVSRRKTSRWNRRPQRRILVAAPGIQPGCLHGKGEIY